MNVVSDPIEICLDYIPYEIHVPIAEKKYRGRDYTVYQVKKPLSLGERLHSLLKIVALLPSRHIYQENIAVHLQEFKEGRKQIKAIFTQPSYPKQELLIRTSFLMQERQLKQVAKDKDLFLSAVKSSGLALQHAHSFLKKDMDVVLEAVKQNGFSLEYAHPDLLKNKHVVLAAVKQNGLALQFADPSLKKDKELILAAIRQNGFALLYTPYNLSLKEAPSDIKKNKEIVLVFVKKNGINLQHSDLKDDKEVVLAAVKDNGNALQYASERLKKDLEIVLAAVQKCGSALCYADASLKKDKKIILAAIQQHGNALRFAHDDFKRNKEAVLLAVKNDDYVLQFAHEDLKKDREIVLAAVKRNCYALQYADAALKQDEEIVLMAIKSKIDVLRHAHLTIRQNREFIFELACKDIQALVHASDDLKQDRAFMITMVRINGLALQYADTHLKSDLEVVLEAVKNNGMALIHVADHLKNDQQIIEAAHLSLMHKLQLLMEDPSQLKALSELAFYIINYQQSLLLHEEHPLLQQTIEAAVIARPSKDPKSPYQLHANLQKIIAEEPLFDECKIFRQRAAKRQFTFADIPQALPSLQSLFETIEQRGFDKKEVSALCHGITLEEVKANLLGDGKLVPRLLAQRGKDEEVVPLTTMYLYAILKAIYQEDDEREKERLSNRENRLLKFASMVKHCTTGQADAIEQYYIYTIDPAAKDHSQAKIEGAVDDAMQLALKKALAHPALLKEIAKKDTIEQHSHQTLYLKNRYHKQLGLLHTLKFDPQSGVIDDGLIASDPKKTIEIIKKHLCLVDEAKRILDHALKQESSNYLKISYMEFQAYFEKELGLIDHYQQCFEFDEELNPKALMPLCVEMILKKLKYIE
jgi:hypothetical protein